MSSNTERLQEIGIVSGEQVTIIFEDLFPDILSMQVITWHGFVQELWNRYTARAGNENSLNGKVFEGIIACCLYRAGVTPFYMQAKLAFIPNINFDFVVYSKSFGPIVLSAKTSLRERYKQADLEGTMMRQVHRKAKSYLITLNSREADTVSKQITEGNVLGIDQVILATAPEFSSLIENLQKVEAYIPKKVDIISGKSITFGQKC